MATGSSEAASASREFSEDDLADLCEALHKISTKYRFFGLQIGLKMHEIRRITVKIHGDPDDCLLEVLSARLNQEPALTCADVVRALRSENVGEHSLALEFQGKFECKALVDNDGSQRMKNEESDSGSDSSEDREDSEGKSSDEEEKSETDEESYTSASEEEVKKKKPRSVPYKEVKEKNRELEEGKAVRRRKMKRVGGTAMESSKLNLQRSVKKLVEACRNKHRGESLSAIGSSSPSTLKQQATKKEGKRKKHVRKMKETREREKEAPYCGRDQSSSEVDMVKNQYDGEMKELVNIFERFFGQLCCVNFNTKFVAAELLKKGLISKAMMRDMMLSPESQQARIISLIDELNEMIKSHPDCLYELIEMMLENDALQETAKEMLREAGTLISCTCV